METPDGRELFDPDPSEATDLRVLRLEVNAVADSRDIASLRSSRHIHGDAIQKHELWLASIQQTLKERYDERFESLELDMDGIKTVLKSQNDMLIALNQTSQAGERKWERVLTMVLQPILQLVTVGALIAVAVMTKAHF